MGCTGRLGHGRKAIGLEGHGRSTRRNNTHSLEEILSHRPLIDNRNNLEIVCPNGQTHNTQAISFHLQSHVISQPFNIHSH